MTEEDIRGATLILFVDIFYIVLFVDILYIIMNKLSHASA